MRRFSHRISKWVRSETKKDDAVSYKCPYSKTEHICQDRLGTDIGNFVEEERTRFSVWLGDIVPAPFNVGVKTAETSAVRLS